MAVEKTMEKIVALAKIEDLYFLVQIYMEDLPILGIMVLG